MLNRRLPALAVIAVVALSGCEMVKSNFASQAGTAGDELAAAALTLRYVHEGKVTRPYARSAFINYREVLQGFEPKLRRATGGPSDGEVNRLIAAYLQAVPAVEDPCIDDGCDWEAQARTLEAAADELSQASER